MHIAQTHKLISPNLHNQEIENKLFHKLISPIRYYTGDLVNVTCYSRGSSPPANLHWKINNERVFDEVADMEQYRYVLIIIM